MTSDSFVHSVRGVSRCFLWSSNRETTTTIKGAVPYAAENRRSVANIKNIERDIRDLEGFTVRISKDASQQSLQDYDDGRAARAMFTLSTGSVRGLSGTILTLT